MVAWYGAQPVPRISQIVVVPLGGWEGQVLRQGAGARGPGRSARDCCRRLRRPGIARPSEYRARSSMVLHRARQRRT